MFQNILKPAGPAPYSHKKSPWAGVRPHENRLTAPLRGAPHIRIASIIGMPQFRPYWWINLISWILLVFTLLLTYHQSVSLPKT